MTKYELVYNRDGSHKVLMEALETTQSRLIIVCPWITNDAIMKVIPFFDTLLKKGIHINIGWGNFADIINIEQKYPSKESFRQRLMLYLGWKYAGIGVLVAMEQECTLSPKRLLWLHFSHQK